VTAQGCIKLSIMWLNAGSLVAQTSSLLYRRPPACTGPSMSRDSSKRKPELAAALTTVSGNACDSRIACDGRNQGFRMTFLDR
jgi:hypothetical protein